MAELLGNLSFKKERMQEATRTGYITATDLADYLVLKNVPFREAHGIVGRAVAFCIARGCELDQLTLAELQTFSPVIEHDVYAVLSVEGSINSRVSAGGTGILRVQEALDLAEQQMGMST
jgi:argininosuccinate lyase